jgi:hypothetical protein
MALRVISRRRSRRDDAGGNHARQRALDCPHQSTNDVGFRPFLTCSIAARDNDGGGAPEAVVIPPCNCSANRGVDSTHYPPSTASTSELRNAAEMAGAATVHVIIRQTSWSREGGGSIHRTRYHTRISSAAKAAVARLIGTDGTQEVNLAKCRP